MKLVFEPKDVERILMEKANALGVQANKVVIFASYGILDRVEVFEVEEENPAPSLTE